MKGVKDFKMQNYNKDGKHNDNNGIKWMKTTYTYTNRKYKTVNILKIRKQAPKTQMCAQNTLQSL